MYQVIEVHQLVIYELKEIVERENFIQDFTFEI